MVQKAYRFSAIRPSHRPRPYFPVTILNPATGKSLRVLALIDTGADECALPESFARPLGHVLQMGTAKTVSTGGGEVTAYSHAAIISVEGFDDREAIVDFVPGLETPLLGVNSFLSDFVLTVDYPASAFTLKR